MRISEKKGYRVELRKKDGGLLYSVTDNYFSNISNIIGTILARYNKPTPKGAYVYIYCPSDDTGGSYSLAGKKLI